MQLTAIAALRLFGFERLRSAVDDGAAVISAPGEPANTLFARRRALGLTANEVSQASKVPEADILKAEESGAVTPIRKLLTISQYLGLNDEAIGLGADAAMGDETLAVRLRTLKDNPQANRLTAPLVLRLSEAAWVIAKERELQNLLGIERVHLPSPDSNYFYPIWEYGYTLAERTRGLLNLDNEESIPSARAVIEKLGIPLVVTQLGHNFAGATIENGQHRGIVVNSEGANSNVWIRRMTLCHELGHLLWDPQAELNRLHVDAYDEIDALDAFDNSSPKVEARANAFAVALLAPIHAVKKISTEEIPVREMIVKISNKFGISPSAARHHLQNVAQVSVNQNDLPQVRPSTDWNAQEDFTVDWFPVQGTPVGRRGRFSSLVARSVIERRITLDVAASALGTNPADLEPQLENIQGLFSH